MNILSYILNQFIFEGISIYKIFYSYSYDLELSANLIKFCQLIQNDKHIY